MKENQIKSKNQIKTVGIIGGGIGGSTIALRFAELGIKVVLIEKGKSLVNGPPICHLHAGGNLYREISEEQCLTLLRESIPLIRLYPKAVDYRPTLIAIPSIDPGNPRDLAPRLEKLKEEYKNLIQKDKKNKVLGSPDNYYQFFDREEVMRLVDLDFKKAPENLEQWLCYAVKTLDLDRLKFPLLMVEEYGLNIFRLAAMANTLLEKHVNCELIREAKVEDIQKKSEDKWSIFYSKGEKVDNISVDFLINASGFQTGEIDDMLSIKRNRMVEFKAAYITKWKNSPAFLPELIFHGTRGTKNGMGQLTPYPQGYFQVHGMTPDITLFKDGLVCSDSESSQPELGSSFISKIAHRWELKEVEERTNRSIVHISKYIPSFEAAEFGGKPLFGAQQIPGEDPDLRAANVHFSLPNYACCEIVKASSSLRASDAILEKMIEEGKLNKDIYSGHPFAVFKEMKEELIDEKARLLCEERGYPIEMSKVLNSGK